MHLDPQGLIWGRKNDTVLGERTPQLGIYRLYFLRLIRQNVKNFKFAQWLLVQMRTALPIKFEDIGLCEKSTRNGFQVSSYLPFPCFDLTCRDGEEFGKQFLQGPQDSVCLIR